MGKYSGTGVPLTSVDLICAAYAVTTRSCRVLQMLYLWPTHARSALQGRTRSSQAQPLVRLVELANTLQAGPRHHQTAKSASLAHLTPTLIRQRRARHAQLVVFPTVKQL
jgi:hypothetical protein